MKRLKEKILEDNQLPTPPPTYEPTPSNSSSIGDPTSSTSSSTGDPMRSMPFHTTRSNDTYVYGVGILAVLVIGVCVFFAYPKSKKNKSMKKKNRINHQSDIICFRKKYIING